MSEISDIFHCTGIFFFGGCRKKFDVFITATRKQLFLVDWRKKGQAGCIRGYRKSISSKFNIPKDQDGFYTLKVHKSWMNKISDIFHCT